MSTMRRACLLLVLSVLIPNPVRGAGPLLQGPKIDSPLVGRQVWAISSRQAGAGGACPELKYWRCDALQPGWTAASQEEFLADDAAGVVTCFYVHGNRISHQEALHDGLRACRQITSCMPDQRPMRFVIWSWPSAQIDGPLKDVRYKACVSDSHAWHLAWLVDQIRPDAPISLIGYSYGARLVSGSLHLLGGGHLAGHELRQRRHAERLPLHAVLMAGALDSHSLLPGGRNHRAISQVERLLVLVNPRDPVLHQYPLLAGLLRKGPPAMGATGFFTTSLGPQRGKVAQWNVSGLVGGEHDWQRYLYSPAVLQRVRGYALGWGEPEVTTDP